jgi:hypothetical protein
MDIPMALGNLEAVANKMARNRAPGPDGTQVELYITEWEELGPLVLGALHKGTDKYYLEPQYMEGKIIMIPNQGPQTTLVNKRPIMTLNTSYKICAKAYQGWLTSISQRLISAHQSEFLPGRLLHRTLMMTNEMVYHAQMKEIQYVLMKADVIKAYDLV